jgi:dinuclear metal center YbgI/SA1388 family protein
MPTVAETLVRLSQQAPADKVAAWDQHGLQVGDPGASVQRIGVCHEVTEVVVAGAVSQAVDLLITYHPLIFRPLTRLVAGPGPGGRAFRLLSAGVAVATVHTAWDAAAGGTADALASALGLTGVTGFGVLDGPPQIKLVTFVPPEHLERVATALAEAGAGRIGNYQGCSFRTEGTGTFFPMEGSRPVAGSPDTLNYEKEVRLEVVAPHSLQDALIAALVASHPYEEPTFDVYQAISNLGMVGRVGSLEPPLSVDAWGERVARALGPYRVAAGDREMVAKVAVLPGSGGSFLGAVAATGADAYLTGDLSHHQTIEALDLGLAVIDPGHIATERPGVAALLAAVTALEGEVVDLTIDPTTWTRP